MNTDIGLDRFPGLAQLNRSGSRTWRGCIVCIGIGLLIGLGFEALPLELSASGRQWNIVKPPFLPICILLGVVLAGCFYVARTTQQDINVLAAHRAQGATQPAVRGLSPTKLLVLAAGLLVAIELVFFGIYISGWHAAGVQDFGLDGAFRVSLRAGSSVTFFHYVMLPICVAVATYAIQCMIICGRTLRQVVTDIDIAIHRAREYSAISNPAVRLFITFTIVSAILPTSSVFIIKRVDPLMLWLDLFIFACMLAPFVSLSLPILKLRNLLNTAMEYELQRVLSRLDQSDLDEKTRDRLFMRQMYLESRSTWPVGENIRQVFLFGLLPPIAWILAAVVENLLYGN